MGFAKNNKPIKMWTLYYKFSELWLNFSSVLVFAKINCMDFTLSIQFLCSAGMGAKIMKYHQWNTCKYRNTLNITIHEYRNTLK